MAGSYSAQVYHVHDLNALIGGYILSRWRGARLVYDFHELFTEQFRPGLKSGLWRRFYEFIEGRLGKRADGHITVCDSIAGLTRERYAFPTVLTVRNVPWYQPAIAPPAHDRRDKVILYHGAYLRDRGLEQLIAAMAHVRGGTLLLRGDGELETALRAQVHQLGLDSRVVFAPPVPISELVREAAQADIGVVPYIGFCLNNRFCLPNKVFEYMMAGLAVAGSDLPELRNLIAQHDVGGLFDPEDLHDIARVLQQLLDDEPALERMKTNARRVARATYNWEAESVRLVEGYASVVAKSCEAQ
jgi:glycosyltransferase involved in cell wall biosynthesis